MKKSLQWFRGEAWAGLGRQAAGRRMESGEACELERRGHESGGSRGPGRIQRGFSGEGRGSLMAPLPNFFPEFSRRWCVLSDGVLSYYENERAVTPNGEIRASEIVCLAVPPPDTHG